MTAQDEHGAVRALFNTGMRVGFIVLQVGADDMGRGRFCVCANLTLRLSGITLSLAVWRLGVWISFYRV